MTDEEIIPHENDVLMGRGGNNNKHAGNENLRDLARDVCHSYYSSSKKGKTEMSRVLVQKVRELGGRFLERDSTGEWKDVGESRAREKTSQVLRDAVTRMFGCKRKRSNSDADSSNGSNNSNDSYTQTTSTCSSSSSECSTRGSNHVYHAGDSKAEEARTTTTRQPGYACTIPSFGRSYHAYHPPLPSPTKLMPCLSRKKARYSPEYEYPYCCTETAHSSSGGYVAHHHHYDQKQHQYHHQGSSYTYTSRDYTLSGIDYDASSPPQTPKKGSSSLSSSSCSHSCSRLHWNYYYHPPSQKCPSSNSSWTVVPDTPQRSRCVPLPSPMKPMFASPAKSIDLDIAEVFGFDLDHVDKNLEGDVSNRAISPVPFFPFHHDAWLSSN